MTFQGVTPSGRVVGGKIHKAKLLAKGLWGRPAAVAKGPWGRPAAVA